MSAVAFEAGGDVAGGVLADLDARAYRTAMVRIGITPAAFDAIVDTLPLGSVGSEAEPDEKGERLIWLDAVVVDRLPAMRRPRRDLQRRDLEARRVGGGAAVLKRLGGVIKLPTSRRRRSYSSMSTTSFAS